MRFLVNVLYYHFLFLSGSNQQQPAPLITPYLSREFGENTAVSFCFDFLPRPSKKHKKIPFLQKNLAIKSQITLKYQILDLESQYSYIFNKFDAIKQSQVMCIWGEGISNRISYIFFDFKMKKIECCLHRFHVEKPKTIMS